MNCLIWLIIITKVHNITCNLQIISNFTFNDIKKNRVRNDSNEGLPIRTPYNPAGRYEYPFAVVIFRILNESKIIQCGGTIVHKNWVLTTASCLQKDKPNDYNELTIAAGMIDLDNLEWQQKRKIASALIHPQYKKSGENNLAMLKVHSPFQVNSQVNLGALAADPFDNAEGDNCFFLSFGKKADDNNTSVALLFAIKMEAIDYEECRIRNSDQRIPLQHLDQKSFCLVQIAAYPFNNSRGACSEDIGSPCICGNRIQALVSHATKKTCSNRVATTPVIDIGYYIRWIRHTALELKPLGRSSSKLHHPELIIVFIYNLITRIIVDA